MGERASCTLCGGTGKLVLMKSWFAADGYKQCCCAICKGTGQSVYQPDRGYVKAQAAFRTALAKAAPSRSSSVEG